MENIANILQTEKRLTTFVLCDDLATIANLILNTENLIHSVVRKNSEGQFILETTSVVVAE